MLATVVTLVCFLIGIAAIAGAVLVRRAADRDLERRVDLLASTPASQAHTTTPAGLSPTRSKADPALLRIFSFGLSLRWPPHTSALVLLGFAGVTFMATLLLAYWIFGALNWGGFAIGIIGFFLVPQFLLRMEQTSIDRQFVDVFPDAIDMIVRMLRAGLPVSATIRSVAKEATPPVNLIFATLADQMDIGIPFEDALRGTAARIRLEDFRYFSVAASLQRATGGNLAETLDILSDIIRRKRTGRHKAKSVTAEVRMTAIVLGCLPIFIVAALTIIHPDYLAPLIHDPRGNVIAAVSVGLLVLAFVVIRQMMRSVTRMQ